MKRRNLIVVLILFGLVLAGVLARYSLFGSPLLAQVQIAEAKWQARNIASYRISVLRVENIFHAQTNELTVRNGQVVEQGATCIPAPFEGTTCTVRPFDASDYTIPGLFATARALAMGEGGQSVEITFDENFGFPKAIHSDTPEVRDAAQAWSVVSFEALQ